MPSLPFVAKTVRVDYHLTEGGDSNVQNRFFLQYAAALTNTDAQAWADACFAAWLAVGGIGTNTSTQTTLTKCVLTDLSSASAPQAIHNGSLAGTGGSPPVGIGVALVVSQRIQRRYRGGHSRIYLPGMPASYKGTPPLWAGSNAQDVANSWGTTIAACISGCPVAAAPAQAVNISYYQGFTNHTYPSGRVRPVPNPRATPLVDLILHYVGNPKLASQRRRNQQSA